MQLSRAELATLGDTVTRTLLKDEQRSSPGANRVSSREVWLALADLGTLATLVSEERGGLALGWDAMGAILNCFGATLSTQPFLSTAILGGGVLRHAPAIALEPDILAAAAKGDVRLALAYIEQDSRYDPYKVKTAATPLGNGYRLSGEKTLVLGGSDADFLLVTAALAGTAGGNGVAILCVPRQAEGVSFEPYRLIDGRDAATVHFKNVRLPLHALIVGSGRSQPIIDRVMDEAALAVSIEAVGAMTRLLANTVEYCRARNAFGSPVSKFQVIQHQLVDLHVSLEHAIAVKDAAVARIESDARQRAISVSVAKSVVGAESVVIGKAAIQLHGAIGTTEDLEAGRYFKRLLVCSQLFGDVDHHRRRYMTLRSQSRPETTP